MFEKIESKMNEVVEAILKKPAAEITKSDYDILAGEFYRLKSKIDSVEQGKRMAEMVANLWTK